jgi:hypothetical protein
VGVLLVAAMRATAGSGLVQAKAAERVKGRFLADGLVADLAALTYQDTSGMPAFGHEAGEPASSKTAWNDIDDFNGWNESPPQDADGVVMSGMTGWQRAVTIERVNPADPSLVVGSESGAKRVTVTVKHNGVIVATRRFIRTAAP